MQSSDYDLPYAKMFFEDLSPYSYTLGKPVPEGVELDVLSNALNVGWLENGYPFETGRTSWRFRRRLRRLAKDLKNNFFRTFHTCSLCEDNTQAPRGTGEIHVAGPDGVTYVAPALIVHYVARHNYLPPREFIDAVLASGC